MTKSKKSKQVAKQIKKPVDAETPEMRKLSIDELEEVSGGRMDVSSSPPWQEC